MNDRDIEVLLHETAERWTRAQKPNPDLNAMLDDVTGSNANSMRSAWMKPTIIGVLVAMAVTVIAVVVTARNANTESAATPTANTSTPQARLNGTWLLQQIHSQDKDTAPGAYRTVLTLTSDRQFQLATPCLFTSGTFEQKGMTLAFGAPGTSGGCTEGSYDPTVIAAVQILGQGDQRYQLVGDRLVITASVNTSFTLIPLPDGAAETSGGGGISTTTTR